MAKKRFSKNFLKNSLDLPYGSDNVLSDTILDTTRWSVVHELVFKNPDDGKTYMCEYSEGATEMQHETPWEYDEYVECEEVEEVRRVTKEYVPVDREWDYVEEFLEISRLVKEFSKELTDANIHSKGGYEGEFLTEHFMASENFEKVLASFSLESIEGRIAANRENLPPVKKCGSAVVPCNDLPPSDGVPKKFVEKLLDKTNKYFSENNLPLEAMLAKESDADLAISVVSKRENGDSCPPPCNFDLASLFAVYKEQKDLGEKKPMRKTMERITSQLPRELFSKGEVEPLDSSYEARC